MGLKRTKLLDVQVVTGISTVGIFTVGITDCTGPVGVASTTYLRGVIMHNTGVSSCRSGLFVYPAGANRPEGDSPGYATSAYRLAQVDLDSNETFFFVPNYPIVLVDRESIVVEVSKAPVGSGIGSIVNYQLLGDTDIPG